MLGRLQIIGLIGLSFLLGIIGIYSVGVAKGQDKVKRFGKALMLYWVM